MKKLAFTMTAVFALASASVFAQGKGIVFKNSSATAVTFNMADASTAAAVTAGGTAWAPVSGTAVLPGGSGFMAQLYWSATENGTYAPIGTAGQAFSSLTRGTFNGGNKDQPVGAPDTCWLQVKVWETAFGSNFETALGANPLLVNGATRSAIAGESSKFQFTWAFPYPAITTAAGFTGFNVSVVPEPSVFALGLLGLAGMFVLRRRS